ncbi:MAG TPA: putative 2OG-Fe(II) oxygenase [Allosphingosinicella sp.]
MNLAEAEPALAVDPADADAAYNAGLGALKSGREVEALALLERARARHPRDARLWQVAALLHRSLDDLGPAVSHFEKAARLSPLDPLIAHGHARAALEAGRPAAALFEHAHRLAPLDGSVLLGLAAARFAENGPEAALEGIEEQLRIHPGWLPGHALAARLLYMSGRRGEFTSLFERALEAAPAHVDLWRELITTIMHAGLHEEALEAVSRARTSAGPHLAFDANEAVCHAELGHGEVADRLFAPLAAVDDVHLSVRRIRHFLRTGRAREAAELAEPISKGQAGFMVWPYLSLAWRLLGDSRWEWLEGDERMVGVYDLGDALPPLGALADRLRGLHIATGQPLEQSVRGGTQTDGILFARTEPEIRTLRSAVVGAVERHIAQLPPPDPDHPTLSPRRDARVRFSGSWSVRLTAAGHHANHIHPAGWFSSALYVALPDEAERGPPPAGWLTLGEPQAELGLALPPFRTVEPRPGRLVLFPSTMWHGTRPFAEGERLTVAFDVARPS